MHDKMEKVKQDLKDVEELKKQIFDHLKTWYESSDKSQIDTKEFGEIVDVVKDLAEVCKYCWEATYCEAVVCAMEEAKTEEEMGRAGYDNWRYSSGRFAPTGKGHFAGYPVMENPDAFVRRMQSRYGYPMDEMRTGTGDVQTGYGQNGMPGYPGGTSGSQSTSGSNSSSTSGGQNMGRTGYYDGDHPEFGRAYNAYRMSKRGYTQTGDERQRMEMGEHAKEHIDETIQTFRDIWGDLTPDMKRQMKMNLQSLVGEMNV